MSAVVKEWIVKIVKKIVRRACVCACGLYRGHTDKKVGERDFLVKAEA